MEIRSSLRVAGLGLWPHYTYSLTPTRESLCVYICIYTHVESFNGVDGFLCARDKADHE